jgi:hypothetical protein
MAFAAIMKLPNAVWKYERLQVPARDAHVLAAEAGGEQNPRSGRESRLAAGGPRKVARPPRGALAGGADLGVRFGETSRGLRSPDSAGVGLISGARLLTLDLISVCGKACSPAWLLHAMPQPKDVPFPN